MLYHGCSCSVAQNSVLTIEMNSLSDLSCEEAMCTLLLLQKPRHPISLRNHIQINPIPVKPKFTTRANDLRTSLKRRFFYFSYRSFVTRKQVCFVMLRISLSRLFQESILKDSSAACPAIGGIRMTNWCSGYKITLGISCSGV